jgi:hypothetical protein
MSDSKISTRSWGNSDKAKNCAGGPHAIPTGNAIPTGAVITQNLMRIGCEKQPTRNACGGEVRDYILEDDA